MNLWNWIITGGIATIIILVILILYFSILSAILGNKIKKMYRKKNKIKRLKQTRKKLIHKIIILFIFILVIISGCWYINYYQETNLSTEDMINVSDGYYYLRDLEEELNSIKAGEIDPKKSKQTINFIVTSLSSYSIKQASTVNTIEGQMLLNRYYNSMSELGINISRNSTLLLSEDDVLEEALADVKKIQLYQKKVLDFYKVNTSALEAQK